MLRDNAVEVAIFGVLGGVSGACIALLWVAGFKAEHVLALGGAIIGATATVAGAAWLSDRNSRIAHRNEVNVLIEKCAKLQEASRKFFSGSFALWDGLEVELSPDERLNHPSSTFRTEIDDFIPFVREALEHASTLSFEQRLRLKETAKLIGEMTEFHDHWISGRRSASKDTWVEYSGTINGAAQRAHHSLSHPGTPPLKDPHPPEAR